MTSERPYLLRALYEWVVDNGLTPHILVNATVPEAEVPTSYVSDGRVVFNVSPSAVRNLDLGNEWIGFDGRFAGKSLRVRFPVAAVLALFARENGRGMVFESTNESPDATPPDDSGPPKSPKLTVVK